ncbi:unnamed protein product [Caenorhabditis sp. 36 PRJEB53466]|nr:unnamed protein product [Caenorhabditis sp. 36 PRJEB53466]
MSANSYVIPPDSLPMLASGICGVCVLLTVVVVILTVYLSKRQVCKPADKTALEKLNSIQGRRTIREDEDEVHGREKKPSKKIKTKKDV